MHKMVDEHPPPSSRDVAGWRRAIENKQLCHYRLESIVSAIQDLGPSTDKQVLNSLAKHLSDALIGILRQKVSIYHANRGDDIIDRTHGQIFEAILQPHSADGKALRETFVPRVEFRIKDALAVESRQARKPGDTKDDNLPLDSDSENDAQTSALVAIKGHHNPWSAISESIDVQNILEQVTDDRKRLAFRLFMDGIPCKSRKGASIAAALGISDKTARDWVKELKKLLSTDSRVQKLMQSHARGTI